MGIKSGLAALYRHEREVEAQFIETISDEEKAKTGTSKNYSPKDIFAHIAYWNAMMAGTLDRAVQGETPEPYGDIDEANAEKYKLSKDLSWSEVLDHLDQVTLSLVRAFKALPNKDLLDPARFPWQRGQSLWRSVVYVTYYHTMRHLAELYVARGDIESGHNAQKHAAKLQMALDDSQGWQASIHYNLACYYSVAGDRAGVIEELKQAFSLSPDLISWSKHDSDLESMKDDPGYINLVAVD
ncbi:MAG TPA: ClbS/DfsB family four-helix bundle protein [candidate division Zixibacteria bacterium]|nr:ClbS/DfsB family four-helix bundle protein [candidate division Zixibacteria bacterium]